MKKYKLWDILCHSSIELSAVFLILFVIARINPAMGFIGSDQGDWLLLVFCASALANGLLTAAYLFKRENQSRRRDTEAGHGEKR